MRNEITYLGKMICVKFKGKYVLPWDMKWLNSSNTGIKSAPWTSAPSTKNARDTTPGTIQDPMSGGVYDPTSG